MSVRKRAARPAHWEACWRAHGECARLRVELLERELAALRTSPPTIPAGFGIGYYGRDRFEIQEDSGPGTARGVAVTWTLTDAERIVAALAQKKGDA